MFYQSDKNIPGRRYYLERPENRGGTSCSASLVEGDTKQFSHFGELEIPLDCSQTRKDNLNNLARRPGEAQIQQSSYHRRVNLLQGEFLSRPLAGLYT